MAASLNNQTYTMLQIRSDLENTCFHHFNFLPIFLPQDSLDFAGET
jgi:hypothetical protein